VRQAGKKDAGRVSPLLVLLVAGGLLRLALWAWFQDLPPQISDEKDYNVLAINLLQHAEFSFTPGHPTALRPPLYPALVAGVYGLFGVENFQAVRLIQIGLSLLNVLLLYHLGLEVSSRRVAHWLAGLYCFYPSVVVFTDLLLTETLFTFLLCAACYTLVRAYKHGALAYLFLTGGLLGLAALTRSVVWMSPPFLCLFVLLTWQGPWRQRLLGPALLLLAFALTLAPWVIRNTRQEGTFVAVDTMGGRNFMMGNYQFTPLYRSWATIGLEGERGWFHEVCSVYPLEERNSQGKIDKLALRQGLTFVKAHPWLTFQRDLIKFFDFWGLERELVAGADRGYFGSLPREATLVLTLLIFGSYVAVMILGIFGLILVPLSDRRIHWFLLLVIVYICGMHTLVFGHSRYHLPIMPLVLVFSARALVHSHFIWQQRRRWSFWLAVGLTVLLGTGWLWGVVAGDLERFLRIVGMPDCAGPPS
jgi:4-amino-4-deoxy-L-arabinose transferase-like glycosyltransferase